LAVPEEDSADLDLEELSAVRQADAVRVGRWDLCEVAAAAGLAWECVCVDAEQAEDVWVHTEEAAGRAWVETQLDGDHACGVRTEADAAGRGADTARAGPATAGGVEDGAENRAGAMGTGIMGADTGTVIDPYEYARNNSCE